MRSTSARDGCFRVWIISSSTASQPRCRPQARYYAASYRAVVTRPSAEQSHDLASLEHTRLLCSEAKPDKCHRRLAAEYLRDAVSAEVELKIAHLSLHERLNLGRHCCECPREVVKGENGEYAFRSYLRSSLLSCSEQAHRSESEIARMPIEASEPLHSGSKCCFVLPGEDSVANRAMLLAAAPVSAQRFRRFAQDAQTRCRPASAIRAGESSSEAQKPFGPLCRGPGVPHSSPQESARVSI